MGNMFHLLKMFGIQSLFIFLIFEILLSAENYNETKVDLLTKNRKLKFVLAIWRHGDRAVYFITYISFF